MVPFSPEVAVSLNTMPPPFHKYVYAGVVAWLTLAVKVIGSAS